MLIFQRTIENVILKNLFKGRMIAIFGPRQSGKTTLSKQLILPYSASKTISERCQVRPPVASATVVVYRAQWSRVAK